MARKELHVKEFYGILGKIARIASRARGNPIASGKRSRDNLPSISRVRGWFQLAKL